MKHLTRIANAIYIGGSMAKRNGFGWFNESASRNDALEPDVFDLAEKEISTDGFTYGSGRPITGICGFEASYNRMQDDKDSKRRMSAYAKVM